MRPGGGSEPGEGEGERGSGAAADCGEPPQADRPGGNVGVADVDLQQARAQVVSLGQAPDVGLGGLPIDVLKHCPAMRSIRRR